jgi:hypothetical protein
MSTTLLRERRSSGKSSQVEIPRPCPPLTIDLGDTTYYQNYTRYYFEQRQSLSCSIEQPDDRPPHLKALDGPIRETLKGGNRRKAKQLLANYRIAEERWLKTRLAPFQYHGTEIHHCMTKKQYDKADKAFQKMICEIELKEGCNSVALVPYLRDYAAMLKTRNNASDADKTEALNERIENIHARELGRIYNRNRKWCDHEDDIEIVELRASRLLTHEQWVADF